MPENAFKSKSATTMLTCTDIIKERQLEFEEIAQEIVDNLGEVNCCILLVFCQNCQFKIPPGKGSVSPMPTVPMQRAMTIFVFHTSVNGMMIVLRNTKRITRTLIRPALREDVGLSLENAWKMPTVG